MIPSKILEGMPPVIAMVTKGLGASIAWPALLRKLERSDPGYKL
jgi:hypothetical protein